MKFKGFVGPSYQTPAVQVDAERSVNLYPEIIAGDGGGPEESVLIRTPGLSWMSAFNLGAAGEGRGMFAVGGRCFAVVADRFYELTATLSGSNYIVYSATLRGSVTATGSTGPLRLACNGVQIMILGNLTAYLFDLRTNVLTDLGYMGFSWNATGLAVVDTYFVAVSSSSNQFQISAPLNGLSWTAMDFGSTQEADSIVALEELHGYLWIFGSNRSLFFRTPVRVFSVSARAGEQGRNGPRRGVLAGEAR
jgi:hypothetical protein